MPTDDQERDAASLFAKFLWTKILVERRHYVWASDPEVTMNLDLPKAGLEPEPQDLHQVVQQFSWRLSQ